MKDYEEYLELLPTEPPQEIYKWIEEQGPFRDEDYKNHLVYRPDKITNPLTGDTEKVMRCHCLACGSDFTAAYMEASAPCCHAGYAATPAHAGWYNSYTQKEVYAYQYTECPECHKKVYVYGSYDMHNGRHLETVPILTVENKQSCLILIEWGISIYIDKYGVMEYRPYAKNGYIADGKRIIRATRSSYGEWCKYKIKNNTWAILSRYDDIIGDMAGHIYPFAEDVLKGTCAENSKLDLYVRSGAKNIYPVSYLKLYLNHKHAENLIMQGMSEYVSALITKATEEAGNNCYYTSSKTSVNIQSVDWKQKKPYKMLGLDNKLELEMICKKKISPAAVEWYSRYKSKIKIDELMFLQRYINKYYNQNTVLENPAMAELFDKERNPVKAIKYLLRQNKRKSRMEFDVRYLLDYWNMAAELKYNLKDTAIKYPSSLKTAHDNAASAHEAKENAELDLKIARRYEQLKKYCYETDGLEIHPAKSSAEFIKEGAELNHCVGTYTKRHARGDTAIFFIRHSDTPDIPYFTLELDEQRLTVRQNRGQRNCARTEEVAEFEKKWLKYIKRVSKEEKSNGKRNSKTAA